MSVEDNTGRDRHDQLWEPFQSRQYAPNSYHERRSIVPNEPIGNLCRICGVLIRV